MRITKRDRSEYQRIRRNVLAKIRRTQQTHNIDLSREIRMKDLEDMSRQEFNAFKEQARSFTRRGNPNYTFTKINDHVSISVAERDRLNYLERVAERAAEQRFNKIKDKPFYAGGKPEMSVGEYVNLMADPDIPGIKAPNVLPDDEIKSREYVQGRIQALTKYVTVREQERLRSQLKENYINKYMDTFGEDEVLNIIKDTNDDDFLEMYAMSDDMDISMFYIENDDMLNTMKEDVERFVHAYNRGDTDRDFQNARNNIG